MPSVVPPAAGPLRYCNAAGRLEELIEKLVEFSTRGFVSLNQVKEILEGECGNHWLYRDETLRAIEEENRQTEELQRQLAANMTAIREGLAVGFFRSALSIIEKDPVQITTDGHASYLRAIEEVLGSKVNHRCSAYKNRRIEQDHRGIKQRYYAMLGFGSLPCARRFCRAFEEVRQYFRPRRKRNQFISLAKQRSQFVSKALTLAYLFEAA